MSRTIIKRTYVICLTTDLLQKDVEHISFVFLKYNNVPKWVIHQYYVKRRKTTTLFVRPETLLVLSVQPEINYVNDEKSHLLVLPYVGQKGEKSIKSMKRALKYHSPNNIVTKSAYSASKRSNKFNIRSKIKQHHQHDVTYYVKYLEKICREDYTGETGRRLSECVINHSGSDKNSHVLKYWIKKEHKLPFLEDFMILRTNCKKSRFRRKLSDSLYIKEKRSPLSTQEKSVTLKLFN